MAFKFLVRSASRCCWLQREQSSPYELRAAHDTGIVERVHRRGHRHILAVEGANTPPRICWGTALAALRREIALRATEPAAQQESTAD
jgi:hypothetical protein